MEMPDVLSAINAKLRRKDCFDINGLKGKHETMCLFKRFFFIKRI